MKKTLLAMLLAGSSSILFAQDTQTNTSTNNNTNTNTTTTTDTPTTTNNNPTTSDNTTTDMNATNQMNSSNQTNTTNQMNSNTQMNTTDPQGNTMSNTSNYNAYSSVTVPATVNYHFRQANPGATNERWEQKGEWYRVSYRNNNQDMLMYYNAKGEGYAVATPVMHTFVPTEVVQMARNKYGWDVYDIKMIKGGNGQNLYQARIIQNGELRTETWDESGNTVLEADIYRRDTTVADVINTPTTNTSGSDMNSTNMNNTDNSNTTTSGSTTDMNTTTTTTDTSTDATSGQTSGDAGNNNNSNEVKIKAEATTTGQETKIKAKDGKVKVKTDD